MSKGPATALITGAAVRIGAAIVDDLSAAGFNVAVHSRKAGSRAKALVDQALARGVKACTVPGDLTNSDDVRQLFAATNAALGPVDLLINNASIFEDDSVSEFNEALWDDHFAVHVKAPALLTQLFAAQNGGTVEGLVVNIIDQRVLRLNPRFFSYTLSKSALWTATITMAQALAPRIRVNAIGPGPTLSSQRQSAADFARQVESLPMQNGPQLADFGRTIRFFYHTPAVTGQMIALDGGQHLAWQTPDVDGVAE